MFSKSQTGCFSGSDLFICIGSEVVQADWWSGLPLTLIIIISLFLVQHCICSLFLVQRCICATWGF